MTSRCVRTGCCRCAPAASASSATAARRIRAVAPLADGELLETPNKRSEPRIPFGSVVERGLLKAGDELFDLRRRWTARISADGSIVAKGTRGSIHQVGARVQNAPACNGWTFWHYSSRGKATPIDALRQKIRGEMG